MAKREVRVMVALSDHEAAVLDEHRGAQTRAAYMRSLVHGPRAAAEVASRQESLAILSAMARDGKQQAACCLAKLLNEGPEIGVMDWIMDAR